VRSAGVLACIALACHGRAQDHKAAWVSAQTLQHALTHALLDTRATAVVLRLSDGAVLARRGIEQAATPGSTIKPLLLSWALQHGVIKPDTTVFCRRSLMVGTQRLPCTHPPDQTTFTAQSALAESCNTYFAELGVRMRGSDLEAALRSARLPHGDATNDTPEQRQLTALGLRGVTATPMQLASAYRELLLKEDLHGPVIRGLADSVQFGMADPARVDGVELLGKTGTASSPQSHWSHGWFAGAVPGQVVLVIYMPHGNGGTAAQLAGTFVRAVLAEQKQ
jgi:cell division protein FtsI/penicillin-binding protein 2